MAPNVAKGATSVAFVRLSVRPSVAYIEDSRTQRPSVLKFKSRFPALDVTCIPVSMSNGQRSVLEAGGGIPCRPNPAATLLFIDLMLFIKSALETV